MRTQVDRFAEVVRDVVIEMHARRMRAVLMMTAVALATGALVAAIAISSVAAHQVDADLAASTLDVVSVTVSGGGTPGGGTITPGDDPATGPVETFPRDAELRAENLDLVAGAGRRLDVTGLVPALVSRDGLPTDDPVAGVSVAGMTSGYLRASAASVGDAPAWMLDGGEPVVFLGPVAAEHLGIPVTDDPTGLSVSIDGVSHSVVGFLHGGSVDLAAVVAVPYTRAVGAVGDDRATRMLVRVERGAGAPISRAIRLALRPDAPERLTASQVVDVNQLRTGVTTQLDRLAAGIGGFLLMLTILLIANAMVVSVMARTSEIGVRRAMGASRRNVAALFLAEGALTGLLGGLAGSAFALVALVVVAAASSWTATVAAWWLVLGPGVGVLAGLISSLYPALRAATIQPALAVRSD
ncbi:ABC transporter permease [Sanguibacter suaedae]|uniref:ABC transporter permease n=1 Tax=Sanguibacter suaedae TaxID=2795737 RepID=A0A934IDG2_9MICO|nr:ABC transporter permease [Sanguibacter suaedae]MBI9115725.1 ABC transporter permease [Sanguibacter suaedae]